MLPDQGKLGSVDANHRKSIDLALFREAIPAVDSINPSIAHLSESPEIEQRQTNHLQQCVMTKKGTQDG